VTRIGAGAELESIVHANKHILVVENDDSVRHVLASLLEGAGYTVACAVNGREALDHLRRSEPPLAILLDLDMPVMDGRQFRKEQCRDPVLADIPVLILSGEPGLSEEAASLGAGSHFAKPIEIDCLFADLRLLGDAAARQAVA
jgi:CheY-like chemotaxis protein